MKKIVVFSIVVVFSLVVLVACGGGESGPSGTAAEISDKIFVESGVEHFGMSQAITSDEEKAFFLGSTDYPEFADAVAVMPMINLDTRVLVVIKAADPGGVEDLKTKLKENVDPNRVVCVTFSLEDVAIESRGDVVLLTINTDAEQRTALVEAFKTIE